MCAEMSDVDRGWIAGIIEGEGSILLSRLKYPTVSVVMTDLDVMQRLVDVTGLGVVRERPLVEGNKQAWRWQVCSWQGVSSLLQQIYLQLGARRREAADRVLEHWSNL